MKNVTAERNTAPPCKRCGNRERNGSGLLKCLCPYPKALWLIAERDALAQQVSSEVKL